MASCLFLAICDNFHMGKLGDIIRKTRLGKGLGQKDIASKTGLSIGYISEIETNKKQPAVDTLQAIAVTLGVSSSYLLGEADIPVADDSIDPNAIRYIDEFVKVPVLDVRTCAGFGTAHAHEDIEVIGERMIEARMVGAISIDADKRPFATRIEGDSMSAAGLYDGVEVVINPIEDVRSGDAALVCYGDDRTTAIKWVYFLPGGVIEIRSATPGFPVYRYTKEEQEHPEHPVIIIGKVMVFTGVPKRGI